MCCENLWSDFYDEGIFVNRFCRSKSCGKYVLPIYRGFALVYLLQLLISFNIYMRGAAVYQLVFLTMWGILLTTITFGLLFIQSFESCRKCCCRYSVRITHIFYNLSLNLGIVILVIFWGALMPYLVSMKASFLDYFYNTQLHLFT